MEVGGFKTPILGIYPHKQIFHSDEVYPIPPLRRDLLSLKEVLPPFRELKGRIKLQTDPEGDLPDAKVLIKREEVYLKEEPVEGTIELNGEIRIITPPPYHPLPINYHRNIIKTAFRGRKEGSLTYAPFTATPLNTSLLLYSGIDIVDNIRVIEESVDGYIYVNGSKIKAPENLKDLPGSVSNLVKGDIDYINALIEHNNIALFEALYSSAMMLAERDIRIGAEVEGARSVENSLWLREADEVWRSDFEKRAKGFFPSPWEFSLRESLSRPQILRWTSRFEKRYVSPDGKKVLLLLPCSSTKPYSLSPTHKRIKLALEGIKNFHLVHEVILTSPLGAVPRELEEIWPAMAYDISVTGRWFEEEIDLMDRLLKIILSKHEYMGIIWALPDENLYDGLSPSLPSVQHVFKGKKWKLDSTALLHIKEVVQDLLGDINEPSKNELRTQEEISSLRFELGSCADEFRSGKVRRGKNRRELYLDEEKVAYLLYGRGKHYLTLKGGMAISNSKNTDWPWVKIEDFHPKGKVFLQGILDAWEEIRPGDEVVIIHDNEVRGVGEASLPGEELKKGVYRGMGVKMREIP